MYSVRVTVVTLCVAAGLLPFQHGMSAERLTWDHVYGRRKIVIRDPAPDQFDWLNDTTLLVQEDAWQMIDADSGVTADWYDRDTLESSLLEKGIAPADASSIADGNWKIHDAQQHLCVLHRDGRLIRAALDGTRIQQIDGLPLKIELLTLSPTGNACAFVVKNNLWSADFESGKVQQLTRSADAAIRCGKADWIYYEEVYRRKWKAFEFSPDGRSLLFQTFDDTQVPEFRVIDHARTEQQVETEHYPTAGATNPTVKLGVVRLDGSPVRWVKSPYNDETTLITRFGWYPDSQSFYWYAQDRAQTWLEMIRSDIESMSCRKLIRETTEAWVPLPPAPMFLESNAFLFLSERSGWRHIERICAGGDTRQSITSGDWDVTQLLAVNESGGWLLLSGRRDSPIADNIYRVSLQDSAIHRLTPDEGHHVAAVNASGTRFLDTWSAHTRQKSVVMRDEKGTEVRRIHESVISEEISNFEFGTVGLRDVPLADRQVGKALVVYPPKFDTTQPHPVWLKTYGGPRFARVKDAWSARLSDHLLASHGIVVLHFDPRTSGGFGASGAWKAYRQLGVEETRDVESICNWLAEQPWADADRIGMSGHSYGGYLTSYVMTHTQCLAAGIAGSPVTDWANYDTIYTERYMSTPDDNPQGYRDSSVIRAAAKLHGQLLLVHGLRDDNVHPANSFQFVRALQQAGRKFEFMVYPKARHGIHDQHYRRLHYDFIVRTMNVDAAN